MKYLLITLFSIVYLFTDCYGEERLELKDQKDKESYGLGYPFGQTLKFQGVDTEALQLMKEGSKWQLFMPPELGYGERGMGRIPPNSTLIFEVELISIN